MNFWHNVRALNAATWGCVALLVLAVLFQAARWAAASPRFDIQVIELRSSTAALKNINSATVRANALPSLQGGFFTLDLTAAQRAFESVPWVRKASIARYWPNKLVVTVEEQVPVALWRDGRGINAYGEAFAVNPAELEQYNEPTPLPQLSGPAGSEAQVAQRLKDFQTWFAPLQLPIREVELSPRYAWRITLGNPALANGSVVELGREADAPLLQQRAQQFVTHYSAVNLRWGAAPRYVDLRYPNGFAIKVAGVKFNSESALTPVGENNGTR